MFRLQNYHFLSIYKRFSLPFVLKKRRVITYQYVLIRLNFHFKSTNNIIHFKITQRKKNKIKVHIYFYLGITNHPSIQ